MYGSATSPGTIHSDSDASDSGCSNGSNSQLFQGHQLDGIAAYGATNGVAGLVTSVATQNGKAADIVADNLANVYGTTAANEFSTGVKSAVVGRKRVTRKVVDRRYLNGVTAATRAAYATWNLNHNSPTGFTRDRLPHRHRHDRHGRHDREPVGLHRLPRGSGITLNGTIKAGTVYFHGFIKGGVLSMPNATKVYVDDTNDSGAADSGNAISLSNNTAFCVRATTCSTATPATGQCPTSPTLSATSKAQLFLRRGMLSGSGTSSLLRLCNTTVIMEGGDIGAGTAASPGGCLPTTQGIAPTATPCPSSGAGDGSINTSGVVDWTAPNAYNDMNAAGLSTTAQQVAWDGGEDLALWTETYGTSSTYKMAGGGSMRVAGVFMVPNAFPFNLTGSGAQDLSNAQYVVRGFAVAGGATLTMKVDPNNVVGLPSLYDFRTVR